MMSGGITAIPGPPIVLTEDLQHELSCASPLPNRIGAVGALTELLTTIKLEEVT